MPSTIDPNSPLARALQAEGPRPSIVGFKAVITGATAWALIVCGIAYLVEKHRPSATPPLDSAAIALDESFAPSLREATPVLFNNPFDPTEVFEFPPGTGEAEARDAVAQMLLARARDRLEYVQQVRHTASTATPPFSY